MADIKGKLKNDLKNMPYIRQFLHEYFDLGKDKDNEAVTVESIRNGVEFKGTNLWILIFAIFIASLGLNVNSTAVIIGAMLISPLMSSCKVRRSGFLRRKLLPWYRCRFHHNESCPDR